ncbi:RNA-directed DNA polymerase, eukaryota, reverse transcriptase zinc-binding domain protein [Tanacetum coccineum]
MDMGDADAPKLRSCLALKLHNIDGKILGKDGKPMKAYRTVQFNATGKKTATQDVSVGSEFVGSDYEHVTNAYVETRPVEKPLSAGKGSFASLLQKQSSKNVVHISKLRNDEVVEGATIAIPLSAVEEFDTKEGMEKVIENGPWLVRRVPLILNVWTPNTVLRKEEVKKALVWVKMHHVPIAVYFEVGLSMITTQIGSPIMLDTYTSNMCVRSWGKKEYARALIEISAERELMESIVITIPLGKGKGHTLATIDIDYEWKPPLCSTCKIFDHTNEKCPKLPRMNKARPNLHYRRVEKGETSSTNSEQAAKEVGEVSMRVDTIVSNHVMPKESDMPLKNAFDALNDENDDTYLYEQLHNDIINASDNEDVDEELIMKDSRGNKIVNVSRDI